MSTRAFVIVTAAQQAAANALAKSTFDKVGGQFTFRAGLVPVGSPEGTAPTHYIASADFTDANWELLPVYQGQFPGSYFASYDLQKDPNAPWTYCASVGLMRPVVKMP
jgi:hypothetical protein